MSVVTTPVAATVTVVPQAGAVIAATVIVAVPLKMAVLPQVPAPLIGVVTVTIGLDPKRYW